MTTVLITGASTGIGRELALAWAARGATLVLSARSRDKLDEVAREVERLGARAIVEPGDVTNEAHRARLVERATDEGGSLDVLVNNAGRGFQALVSKIDLDAARELFELNVFAPLRLTQLALPHLERARGTIVMMSSISGLVAIPRSAVYAASKFALEALAMTMRSELADKGVRVVVIRPGPVDTPFRANAARSADVVGYDRPAANAQSAKAVALLTLRAVDRGTPVVETTAKVRLASAVSRFAPAALRIALRRMAGRPEP